VYPRDCSKDGAESKHIDLCSLLAKGLTKKKRKEKKRKKKRKKMKRKERE